MSGDLVCADGKICGDMLVLDDDVGAPWTAGCLTESGSRLRAVQGVSRIGSRLWMARRLRIDGDDQVVCHACSCCFSPFMKHENRQS
jgi:hypothetical protein